MNLHDLANTFEPIGDTLNHRNGYNLFDDRFGVVDHVVAQLNSYADQLRAAIEVDPMPPVKLLAELTEALDSPERDAAIALIQADYKRVRESDQFCTRLTDSASDSVRVRVQHCESGMWTAATCKWDGYHQIITDVSTNLAGKGDISDRACPVDQRRLPPFRHLVVPPWTKWDGIGGLQIWRYTRMGIGSALYRRAHNIFPNARWIAGNVYETSHGLRESLHRHQPWHWEAPRCAVCGTSADAPQLKWAESTRNELAAAHEAGSPTSQDHMGTG